MAGGSPQRPSSTPTQAPDVVTSLPSLPAPRQAQQLLRERMQSLSGDGRVGLGVVPLPTDLPGALQDQSPCCRQVWKARGCWSEVGRGGTHCCGNRGSWGAGQGASEDFWLGLLWGSACGSGIYMGLPGLKLPGALARALASPGMDLVGCELSIPTHRPPRHQPVKTKPNLPESKSLSPTSDPGNPRTPQKGRRRRLRLWCQGGRAQRWEGGSVSCP